MNLFCPIKCLNKKWRLSRDIVRYFDSLAPEKRSPEQNEVVEYLRHRPASIFPYSFCDEYKTDAIDVRFDSERNQWYVLQDGHRIYVKRGWKKNKIQRKYRALLLEQDPRSPHRYLTPSFDVSEGDVLVDIGTAEGNFALSVIEKVKRIYLIEADREWIDALEATFAPWKEKVVIINKFVSDKNEGSFLTLDALMALDPEINFVKIDVDGAERELLAGAQSLLQHKGPLKVALCTYHRQGDEEEFNQLLLHNGFTTEFSRGYMLFFYNRQRLSPPFFRRGLIRASKTQ